MNTESYRQRLVELRDLLLSVGDKRWGPRLEAWIVELDASANDDALVLEHVRRTRRAVAGMGSMGDVVICREAGHLVPDESAEVDRLNVRQQQLVHSLFIVVAKILGEKYE